MVINAHFSTDWVADNIVQCPLCAPGRENGTPSLSFILVWVLKGIQGSNTYGTANQHSLLVGSH